MIKFFLKGLIFLIFFSISAQAKNYFAGDLISPVLIENPLDRNSQIYKDEIYYIIKIQNNLDLHELEKARDEHKIKAEMMFVEIMPKINRDDFPQLYILIDNIIDTTLATSGNAKAYWNTKRPYLSDSRIKALIKTYDDGAYPSGHAASSYVMAKILGLLISQERVKFETRAVEISNHRVLSGMHFPHDIEGGRRLGLLVVGALMQSEEFLRDFKNAQQELSQKYH